MRAENPELPRTYPNREKKRENKRRLLRLEHQRKRDVVVAKVKHMRANVDVVMLRGPGEVVFVPRRGLFGHARAPAFRLGDEEVVGAIEDVTELGGICTKLGVMVLAQLTGHHLAMGSDGLAAALAKWAGIDVEALKKAAEEDAIAEAVADVKEAEDGGLSEGPGVAADGSDTGPTLAAASEAETETK